MTDVAVRRYLTDDESHPGTRRRNRMVLPPHIHPNDAVFTATNLPQPLTWQHPDHTTHRRQVLSLIGDVLAHNAQLVMGDSDTDHAKLWALARKLEMLLFLRSASLSEYCNADSLARRVQALTAGIVNRKIRRRTPSTAVVGPELEDKAAPGDRHSINYIVDEHSRPQKKRKVEKQQTRVGELILGSLADVNALIWGYLPGVEVFRCRAINVRASILLPNYVFSLQVSCNAIQRALSSQALRLCTNLRSLEIVSLSSGMAFGHRSMRATDCPQRFVVTHDDHEEIVLRLSRELRSNKLAHLRRLVLTCLFTNEQANGEANVLLESLMTGACPQLQELCLPGNSFGDYGAEKVAQLLRSGQCPELTRLDLRRNFIGELGIRRVCHALEDGCAVQLSELCLGGNTMSDSSFYHVLDAMESRQLPKLRFLGIEMNYLTADSMRMLGCTIGKLVCPHLSQISYSENSVENGEAKRLIATSVYNERIRRQRLASNGESDDSSEEDI